MPVVPFDDYEMPFWEPIGKYVFRFGYLERDVDWSLSALSGLEYRGHGDVLFSQIRNLSSRVSLLNVLTRKATKDIILRSEMEDVVKAIREQNTYRNNLVHGAWGGYFQDILNSSRSSWQKLYINPNSIKMAQFSTHVEEILEKHSKLLQTQVRLTRLTQQIVASRKPGGAQPPSGDILQPPLPTED
jgi:hypothetical protein